jgi:hypothetical protein
MQTTRGISAPLRVVATSVACLAVGFALWFGVLAAETTSTFMQSSRHMHEPSHRSFSVFGIGWAAGVAYATAFFAAAILVSRARWHLHAPLSAFLGYAAFVAVYLPSFDWTQLFSTDVLALIAPLAAAPLGGVLGERLLRKHQTA